MVLELTATITFTDVDLDTGEMVTTVDAGRGPTEVRLPLERALGWKERRRERMVINE